ncbi:MAG: CRISPR system precrRNA processing endoribonuclease RAMP protein Cas6 [Desulfuromonadaceae bacterium]|nr:CRISPR system precrRNA processing endoribonuclease RAMP protein Cas6 [Desulfuromonas sp.]MDY0185038.1 CRISPR system precrRNA processing endoribonuclease RAMP protein Cas6 [Desulfuromonadaceae bacterium]
MLKYNDIRSLLTQAEFAHLRFECRMDESIDIDMSTLLRLRRRMRTAARHVLQGRPSIFRKMFEPSLPADPLALKRYQKGAPAFVLCPAVTRSGRYAKGELLQLEVMLFGDVHAQMLPLIEVFLSLGAAGLRLDSGRFVLERVTSSDASGVFLEVWNTQVVQHSPNIPLLDLGWWLGGQAQSCCQFELEFNTPARLLTRGKPMFTPEFKHLYPFMLRRVTSMLYIHCGVELDPLMFEMPDLVCVENKLYWHDWRELRGDSGATNPLGGVRGSLHMRGDVAGAILPLLQLGSVMNLGKNAAFGAGSYRLSCR